MVSTRINFFCYAIIFMSIHFVAHSLQDIDKMVMSRNKFDVEEIMLSSPPEKETLNEVHVTSDVAVTGGAIRGRKMARRVNQEHTRREEPLKKASSSLSGPNIGDQHKLQQISKKIDKVEVKISSTFMVMNADYHVPRSHPPKNN